MPATVSFVDLRLNPESLGKEVSSHDFLRGLDFYQLEPKTNSSMLTVPVLPLEQMFIAQLTIYADAKAHPTGGDWQYSWERWQVFRTEPPPAYPETGHSR